MLINYLVIFYGIDFLIVKENFLASSYKLVASGTKFAKSLKEKCQAQ